MQAKKRAKSVKFGKQKESKVTVEPKAPTDELELEQEGQVEETKKVEINEPGAEEIKKKIAEKINPTEKIESPPETVDLSSQIDHNQDIAPRPIESEETKTEDDKANSFGSFTKEFDEPEKKKNNLMFFIIVVLITFLVGLAGIGGFYYFSNKSAPTPTPTPVLTPTTEPSPTNEPVDLTGFTVQVLNGSGISGVAAKVKTQLTEAGFTVDTVGNADKTDYVKTIISAKESVDKAFIEALKKELEKTYVVETKVETLPDTNKADVVLIIGSSS